MSLRRCFRQTAFALITLFPHMSAAEKPEENFIDNHVCLAIDNSRSIDNNERRLMVRGIAEGFLMPDILAGFNSSNITAVSIVSFDSGSNHVATEIIHNEAEARALVVREFYDPETDISTPKPPYSEQGAMTSIQSGIETCQSLFAAEDARNGFRAFRRRVLILGDGVNNAYGSQRGIQELVMGLAYNFGAVVDGVPIIEPAERATGNLVAYYSSIVTPAREGGISCECDGMNVIVPAGRVFPAGEGFSSIAVPMSLALRNGTN